MDDTALSPESMKDYLYVLKDMGVRRAVIVGVGEFEFEAPAVEEAEVRYVTAPTPAEVTRQLADAEVQKPKGYASLFAQGAPKFIKSQE